MGDLFDTHCHLNLEDLFPDPAPFLARAKTAGVRCLCLVGLDPETGLRAIEMAEREEDCFAIVGRHPNGAADYGPAELERLRELLTRPKTVALGEVGLDYHWDLASKEQQLRCLIDQLDLAEELDLPVVFHCREAYEDLLALLERRKPRPYLLHCFSGSQEDAKRAVALGCRFGIDGPVTYKKSESLREILVRLPRDRIVLETDSPYLTPVPFRGKPNEPSYLPYVNAAVAQTLEISEDECANLTTRNARDFFRLS